MRITKLLIASAAALAVSASAAKAADVIWDEPAAPTPLVTSAPYNWTGLYLGLAGGAATGDFDYDVDVTGFGNVLGAEVSAGGIFGGGQVGYDYQWGNVVVGAVADIFATDIDADISVSTPLLGGVGVSATSELKYYGTVRARVGYAYDRFLAYGHGGFAYGETEQTVTYFEPGFSASVETDSGNKTGWVVGGGFEYAVTDAISVQTEYSYVDLGRDTLYSDGDFSITEDVTFHAVKAAVNFRF